MGQPTYHGGPENEKAVMQMQKKKESGFTPEQLNILKEMFRHFADVNADKASQNKSAKNPR